LEWKASYGRLALQTELTYQAACGTVMRPVSAQLLPHVVLARRGQRQCMKPGREYITGLGCGAADGTRLPPYTVYKGKNLCSGDIRRTSWCSLRDE